MLVRLLLLIVLVRARILLAIDLEPIVLDLEPDHAAQNDVAERGQLLIGGVPDGQSRRYGGEGQSVG